MTSNPNQEKYNKVSRISILKLCQIIYSLENICINMLQVVLLLDSVRRLRLQVIINFSVDSKIFYTSKSDNIY